MWGKKGIDIYITVNDLVIEFCVHIILVTQIPHVVCNFITMRSVNLT